MSTSRLLVWIFSAICVLASTQTLEAANSDDADISRSGVPETSFKIYCDFRCPFCARLFTSLLAGAKSEGREVNFQFLHYPFHKGSEELAMFYESAIVNYPDHLKPLIESLYKFQGQTEPQNLDRIIPALSTVHGFDLERIKRDMKARDTAFALSEAQRSAVALGVEATPTVFYGGTQMTIREPEEIARFILDHSLRNVKTTPAPFFGDCPSCE